MSVLADQRRELLALSHWLGAEHRDLAILGEGNTSARLSAETFLVKASGSSLGTLTDEGVIECRFAPLLALIERTDADAEEIDAVLLAARVDPDARKPSIEALFHAWLLALPGIAFVGHTHPIAVNAILCSPLSAPFAGGRIFPDEIVCCGTSSVLVPYCDPGLRLAQSIARETTAWIAGRDASPRVILLQSHGLIALGATAAAVQAATAMAVKAARIFAGAASLGGPTFLTSEQVASIAGRRDEHYRQRALNLYSGPFADGQA